MVISNKIYKNTLYVLMNGELDEHSSSHAREQLDKILLNNNFNQVILDLSQLSFMDSTGIGVMLGRYKKMKSRGIPIFIANPSSQAEKIFKMTGLFTLMPEVNQYS